MDKDKNAFSLSLIGQNENGLIVFITGTTELLYLERPYNWEEYAKKYDLPYISHAMVHEVNLKCYREEKNNE